MWLVLQMCHLLQEHPRPGSPQPASFPKERALGAGGV